MDDTEANNVLDSMIQFINNHGKEQADQLRREADQEFTIECEKIIGSGKERLKKIFETRLEKEGIEMKIKRSAAMNKQRIRKMAERNKWAEESFVDSQHKLYERLSKNTKEHKELLKKLIVQCLIKMMEANVKVQWRKSDVELVNDVLEDAAQMYKTLMKENVLMLKGNEPPLSISIDETRYLPEYDSENPANSCLGGVKLHARKYRIVCSNTLDERLQMAYQANISSIALATKIHKDKPKQVPVEEHGGH